MVGERLSGKLSYMQKWHLERRQRAEEAGLCTVCTKRTPITGQKTCEECLAYQKKYRKQAQSKRKASTREKLLSRYDLTLEDYARMEEEQNCECLICGRKAKLCVDHCHKTGKVRGLLCVPCNVQVGYFENHPERIERIKSYVAKHEC